MGSHFKKWQLKVIYTKPVLIDILHHAAATVIFQGVQPLKIQKGPGACRNRAQDKIRKTIYKKMVDDLNKTEGGDVFDYENMSRAMGSLNDPDIERRVLEMEEQSHRQRGWVDPSPTTSKKSSGQSSKKSGETAKDKKTIKTKSQRTQTEVRMSQSFSWTPLNLPLKPLQVSTQTKDKIMLKAHGFKELSVNIQKISKERKQKMKQTLSNFVRTNVDTDDGFFTDHFPHDDSMVEAESSRVVSTMNRSQFPTVSTNPSYISLFPASQDIPDLTLQSTPMSSNVQHEKKTEKNRKLKAIRRRLMDDGDNEEENTMIDISGVRTAQRRMNTRDERVFNTAEKYERVRRELQARAINRKTQALSQLKTGKVQNFGHRILSDEEEETIVTEANEESFANEPFAVDSSKQPRANPPTVTEAEDESLRNHQDGSMQINNSETEPLQIDEVQTVLKSLLNDVAQTESSEVSYMDPESSHVVSRISVQDIPLPANPSIWPASQILAPPEVNIRDVEQREPDVTSGNSPLIGEIQTPKFRKRNVLQTMDTNVTEANDDNMMEQTRSENRHVDNSQLILGIVPDEELDYDDITYAVYNDFMQEPVCGNMNTRVERNMLELVGAEMEDNVQEPETSDKVLHTASTIQQSRAVAGGTIGERGESAHGIMKSSLNELHQKYLQNRKRREEREKRHKSKEHEKDIFDFD